MLKSLPRFALLVFSVVALSLIAKFSLAGWGYTTSPDLSDPTVQIALDVWDSTTAVPSTGLKQGAVRVPFNMTLTGWELSGDASGSAAVAPYYASNLTAIGSAATMVTSTPSATSVQYSSGSVSGFATTSLKQGGYVKANLISVTTMKRIVLYLYGTRD